MACKLEELEEQTGKFYNSKTTLPLTDDKLEAHENLIDTYEQKEVTLCEIIYRTVNHSTFIQIKGEPTAAAIWKKLQSIHADKRSMFKMDLLTSDHLLL